MSKFYLKDDLPAHIDELASYLVEIYRQDGVITFNFHYKPNSKVVISHNPGSKAINYIGNPIISLEKMGFGFITYTPLETQLSGRKNLGVFTISSELLSWYKYKNASPAIKKWTKTYEFIMENQVFISIFISIAALLISIFIKRK